MDTQSALDKQSKQDVAELLYSNSFGSIIINFLAATGVIFTFDNTLTTQVKLIWWLFFVVILIARLIDTLMWRKQARTSGYNNELAIYRSVISILSSSILWAIYCVFIVNQVELLELTFIIVIVFSMAGGAVTVLAAHEKTAITYSFIILVPFSISLFASDEKSMSIIGMLGLAYFILISFNARKSAGFTKQAILWKNKNAILVNSMEEEVAIRTREIYELSNIDPLTELYNRNAFLTDLGQRIKHDTEKNRSFALMFIDLDGFKKVNDSLGHEVGDSILKMTARRLLDICPENGFLCRWGGDEFLLVVDHSEKGSTEIFAQNIIKTISECYQVDNTNINLSATIGIAVFPDHSIEETSLIQWADMAMYSQKKHAPATVGFFDEALHHKVQHERRLKESLSKAINNNQLYLVFQPIVKSSTHGLVAFEALLRWQLEDEVISPVEFIPIAEQYGQINSIGLWVLQQACIIASSWPESIAVSVNVSVIQLQNAEFISLVKSVLIETGLAPQRLHIEITESVFAENIDSIIDRVKSLQQIGIAVYIDDFGTQYSSLSIIQDLSADVVKIDKAFIDRLETNGFTIVKAILNIARALNYQVIAEGVEHKSQADILQNLGVDCLQGYYFSKPMEQAKVDEYIAAKLDILEPTETLIMR
ncbi:MAG: EAL domain-containing protein [Oceanospirillaceae bacterium]